MLILAKITGTAAGGYAEYLEGKAQASALGDYYLKDGERVEAPGRWAAGAERFGLDAGRPVTGEQLRALMAVRRPDQSGGPLRRTGSSGEAVAAIDATFSAPKSVSAAWALADRNLRSKIEQAHETAVDRALTHATRQVPMLRRRLSATKVVHEKAGGLVATSWRHTTARAVGQQLPDPQLHSHVLLHAAVRRDGRLVAIDSRSWLVHQREIGAAYRTELARELQTLGFQVVRGTGRGGRYFEIDGIPLSLLDRWSSRHHQVQAAITKRLATREAVLEEVIAGGGPDAQDAQVQLEQLRETRQLSPKEDRLMGAITRAAKTPVTAQDLDREWQRTGVQHRVSLERLELLRRTPNTLLAPAGPQDLLMALTEFDATFHAREARAAALERSAGTPIATALDQLQALRSTGEILLLADGTGTTRDHRGYERAVVAITQRLAITQIDPIPQDTTERETGRLDQELISVGGRLSDEQRAAIVLACGERPLVVIEGHAGTGKSTTLTGIARAHQHAGRGIIVTSTAALAAERLATELQDHGVECDDYSTAGLYAAINHGRIELTPETTVIHDEAALASTREQLRLLRAVETSGARLIAVGDPQQNQPVGAGGLWGRIEDAARDSDALVELTRNQRALDPGDRHSQALFRKGEIELAIRTYHARDRIHQDTDQQQAEDRALEAAHQDRTNGLNTIVIAQTSNEHLDQLNARAQAIRRQAGQLGAEALPVPGRPYSVHTGDDIQIRHTINHPQHGPLRNGTSATITQVNPERGEVELRLADDTKVTLDQNQIEQADMRLAYVQHPFPAQGHTTDTAHVIVSTGATREGTYVALTRARQQTHMYAAAPEAVSPDTDRIAQLAEQVSQTEPEMPSIDRPLAHETRITETIALGEPPAIPNLRAPATTDRREIAPEQTARAQAGEYDIHASPATEQAKDAPGQPDDRQLLAAEAVVTTPAPNEPPETEPERNDEREPPSRAWPERAEDAEPLNTERDQLERDEWRGWEL